MIKSLLGTALILISLNLRAHVLEVTSEENISLDKTVERSNLKFSQCDEYRINALEYSTKYLANSISRLQKEVTNYKAENLSQNEKRFLKKVSSTLSCINKKVTRKLTFKCVDNKICDNAIMYVKRILVLPMSVQSDVIHTCDSSFYYSDIRMAGVILHETSHLCGAKDIEYLIENEELNSEPQLSYNYKIKRKEDGTYLRRRLIPLLGSKNADSYRYWYHYGFCMPGRDC